MSTSPLTGTLPFLLLSSLLLLAGATAPALADEQIVLPFDCTVVGGKVRARPSSDQAYRIYGAREQKRYRACSEQNPDRCRSFLVHRFTMACGPDRVAWPEFYAAISASTDGRAYFDRDGLLYYRVGARFASRDPDGTAYPFPAPRPGGGVVQMPDGFAPLAGTEAIFTPLDPRVAELESHPRATVGGAHDRRPPQTQEAPFQPVLTAKPPESGASAAKPKPTAPDTAAKAPQPPAARQTDSKPLETASTDKPASSASAAPASAAPAADAVKAPQGPSASGSPAVPTILNNPAAKHVEEASAASKPAKDTVVAAAEIASPRASGAAASDGTSVKGWGMSEGGVRLGLPPIVFAIAIAAATLGALLVILRRQAAAPVANVALRVPVEPVLPGFGPQAPAETSGRALVLRATPEAPAATGSVAPSSGMPSTRAEALALLGLSSDASEAVIRKVAEALRQSWHPDVAADAADRAARTERLKQINVAVDILLRRPAA